jgi:hypothetical protein
MPRKSILHVRRLVSTESDIGMRASYIEETEQRDNFGTVVVNTPGYNAYHFVAISVWSTGYSEIIARLNYRPDNQCSFRSKYMAIMIKQYYTTAYSSHYLNC